MLVITDTPIIEKEYIPEGSTDPKTYTFNTVGVLDNVYIGVTSYQMPILYISGNNYATIHASGDYTKQLKQVSNKTGDLIIYLSDNYNVGYNYSGQYKLTNVQFLNGETTAVLNFTGNTGATFFGEKYFPNTTYSQVVYSYQNKLTFSVYDYTQLSANIFVEKLITTVNQNMPVDGINYLNLSEIILPYIKDTGCKMVRIDVTEVDYFGNTSTVNGRPLSFIYGSIPQRNYYEYIIFNPINKGKILPTSAEKLYFNEKYIYPFYINFILQNIGIDISDAKGQIIIRSYVSDITMQPQDELVSDITMQRGLNSLDLSKIRGLLNIINKEIDCITIQLMITQGEAGGQYEKTQFTEEFVLAGITFSEISNKFAVKFEKRILNDRRDFYFEYNNGIGGISTILSTNYDETVENETISLRNRNELDNVIARSTEVVKITFDQIGLDQLQGLLGFNPDYMFKVNGIYESKKIKRIGSDLSIKEYIIRNASYNKGNQDIYNTVSIEAFRPMNIGFQQIGSVEFEVKLNTDSGGIINLINNSYYDPIRKSCKYGDNLITLNGLNGEYLLASEAKYFNTFDNSKSATIQAYEPTPWISWINIRFYLGSEMQVQENRAKIETKNNVSITIYDSHSYNHERNCEKKYLNVKWVFFGECTNKKFNFWTPSLADQEKTGKTTIEVEFSLKNIQNLLITSYGITVQDGLDYKTYEFYDDEYYKKQLVFVKVKGANALIQVFAKTSQGIRYGEQVRYTS